MQAFEQRGGICLGAGGGDKAARALPGPGRLPSPGRGRQGAIATRSRRASPASLVNGAPRPGYGPAKAGSGEGGVAGGPGAVVRSAGPGSRRSSGREEPGQHTGHLRIEELSQQVGARPGPGGVTGSSPGPRNEADSGGAGEREGFLLRQTAGY